MAKSKSSQALCGASVMQINQVGKSPAEKWRATACERELSRKSLQTSCGVFCFAIVLFRDSLRIVARNACNIFADCILWADRIALLYIITCLIVSPGIFYTMDNHLRKCYVCMGYRA